MENHMLMNGIESTYTLWIHHGEDFDLDVVEHPVHVHDTEDGSVHGTEDENNGVDQLEGMLGDLHTAAEQAQKEGENQDENNGASPHENESFFGVREERGKAPTLSWLHQVFKVLLCGMASSYEVIP